MSRARPRVSWPWADRSRAAAAKEALIAVAVDADPGKSSWCGRSHIFRATDPHLAQALFSFAHMVLSGTPPRDAFGRITWERPNAAGTR